jgi:hypothetical protein
MMQILLSFIFLVFVLPSCSVSNNDNLELNSDLGEEPSGEPQEEVSTDSEQESEVEVPKPEISAIQIEWKAPKTNVTRYILRYGLSPNNLDSEEEIEIEDLKTQMHPLHGKLYKYTLIGLPTNAIVYYTLQAGNENGFSEATPVAKEEAR